MYKKLLISLVFTSLTACGGSGSGSPSDNGSSSVIQGVFIDSPVMGLAYRTATRSGLTDSSGTFEYLAGESVAFSLGGIEFGSAIGAEEITPLDLLGADSFNDLSASQRQQLSNMLILFQSLDADQNPDNGIDLANLDTQLSDETIGFDVTAEEFSSGRMLALVVNAGGRLVDETDALNHFFESTGTLFQLELPVLTQDDFDADGIIDSETIYRYTSAGEIETITTIIDYVSLSESTERSYEYDANGLLARTVYRSLNDGVSEVLSEQRFIYNDQGQLTYSDLAIPERPVAELSRSYDEFGRLQSQELRTPALAFTAFGPAGFILDLEGFTSLPSSPLANSDAVFAASAFGASDAASLYGATQAPLDLSIPGLQGNSFFVGFEPTYSGLEIQEQSFQYSTAGYVDQVTEIESLLMEGATEANIQLQQSKNYDAEGRLISSTGEAFGFQIESLFSFAENGRLNNCSVSVDGTLLIENTDPITSISSDNNEDYQYVGRCPSLIGNLFRYAGDGDLTAIETYIPVQQILPIIDQPARIIRQEFIRDENQIIQRLIGDTTLPDLYTESIRSRDGLIETFVSLDSQGSTISKSTTTFELFELEKMPRNTPFSTDTGSSAAASFIDPSFGL